MIKIEEEPKSLIEEFGMYENCIFCRNETNMWNIETNNPVCPKCAKIKSLEDIHSINGRHI